MQTAYKYMKLDNGLLVVFEQPVEGEGNCTITVLQDDTGNYVMLNDRYLINLHPDVIEHVTKTKKFFVAWSGVFDTEINANISIDLNDLMLGKLLAYLELGMQA